MTEEVTTKRDVVLFLGAGFSCDAGLRGLRLPHIPELINWQLPKYLDDYWRRVGRLAQKGRIRSLIVVDDGHQIQVQVLQNRLNEPIPEVGKATERAGSAKSETADMSDTQDDEQASHQGIIKSLGKKLFGAEEDQS